MFTMVALRYSTLIILIFVMSIVCAIDDAGISTVSRAVSHLSNGDYKKAAVVLDNVDAK